MKFIIAAASCISLAASAPTLTLANEIQNGDSNLRPRQHITRHDQSRRQLLTTAVTYPSEAPYSTALTNPERGFYTQISYFASSPYRLDASSIASAREASGESTILRLFYLDSFVDGSAISQSVLDDVEADFESMRAGGVKCVLRFAYTNVMEGTTDPPKAAALNHISQLTPILKSNQDAILAVQAGFVGPWGEWHGSTNFDDDLEGRKEIVAALLDAVPNRTVEIRTPAHKMALYASSDTSNSTLVSSGHVSNGGVAGDVSSSWEQYMDGFEVDGSDFDGGQQSLKVTNGGAKQVFALTADEGYMVKISGFSKRVGATGPAPWDYAIYADVAYTDITYTYGLLAQFTGADTWNKAVHVFTVPPGKTISTMYVYCMYRNTGQGYALFDGVAIEVYEPSSTAVAEAIDSNNAFDGSHIARTGHHNDCFLASDTDFGTYTSPEDSNEYPYLAQETKYTSMGGETCNPNSPRSDCDKAKEEMELFHYTYLNSGYHQDVIDSWESAGCMEEVRSRLGYRLVLKSGSFGSSAAPGGTVPYSIEVENVGYASPVNTRQFQLVLRETDTSSLCGGIALEEDMREWFGGETHVMTGNLVLPADFPAGTYDLFLNLADASEDLRTDLNFKVKVANVGLNEEETGMINLQHSVTVATGESSAPSNSGETIPVECGIEQDVLPPAGPTGPVKNGGFEGNTAADWSVFMDGYTVDTTFKHSGLQSIKVENGGASQSVSLTAVAGDQVTIKGYSKAVNTSTGLLDYGIYVDVTFSDGTQLFGVKTANFPGGTHDFTLGQKTFTVPEGKTVSGLNVLTIYRDDPLSGVAYFDDVEVTVATPTSSPTPEPSNIALGSNAVASQSSSYQGGDGGEAFKAIDGNTYGVWGGGSVSHTDYEANPWWMVDLGESGQHIINSVSVYNRVDDCCMGRISDSNVEILDDSGNVVASQSIAAGLVQTVYNFDFGNIQGRYVRVQKNGSEWLSIAEVEVMGWSPESSTGSGSPTPESSTGSGSPTPESSTGSGSPTPEPSNIASVEVTQ